MSVAVLLVPSALFGQTPDWVKEGREKDVTSSDINWYDAYAYRGEDETDTQVWEKAGITFVGISLCLDE